MLTIIQADYAIAAQAAAILGLLDAYAADPMGRGVPLDREIHTHLIAAMASRPHIFSLLALEDAEPIGLVNAIESFSTFSGRPVINIHDVYVIPTWRGRGIAQSLLDHAEQIAQDRGCGAMTLEVLAHNTTAQSAYARAGFTPAAGGVGTTTFFWKKPLSSSGPVQ